MTATSALRDAPERALRSLFMGLSHRRSLGRLATRVPITRPMVGRFVAGETLPEVLDALERLREGGYGTTVDVLGESGLVGGGLRGRGGSLRGDARGARRARPGAEREPQAHPDGPRHLGADLSRDGRPGHAGGRGGRGIRPDRHGGPHEDRSNAPPLARAAVGQPGDRGRDPGRAAPERGRRRGPDRRGGAGSPLQGRLQRAGVGRVPRARGGRRGVRIACPPPDARGSASRACDPRRTADRAPPPLRRSGGDRAGSLRVPDALRRPTRSPGGAAPPWTARPRLRAVRDGVVPVLHAAPRGEARQRGIPSPRSLLKEGRRPAA